MTNKIYLYKLVQGKPVQNKEMYKNITLQVQNNTRDRIKSQYIA